jgi:hypothetical protein
VKIGGGLDGAAVQIAGGNLISHQPLVPGESQYQVQYTIPARDGVAVLSVTAPSKVGHVLVFIPDDGTTVAATGLTLMGSEQMDNNGPKTRYYMATSLQAGQTLTLSVTGLKTAAVAPDVLPQTGAAEASLAGSSLPKTIAAVGAGGMLVIGSLILLAKKTPSPVQVKAKASNRGRSHDRR